ncbi:TSUP family transporter [Streptomyces sp. INA 01156]
MAGTSIVTHVATGVLGTAAYTRSGQLREPGTRRVAGILAGTAVLGTPVGVLLNSLVSTRAFGVVLGVLVAVVAALVWHRERHRPAAAPARPSAPVVAGLGFVVAVVSGVVGIGGPMLTVPLLVALGVPVLESLASAQAQSIVIAGVGTVGCRPRCRRLAPGRPDRRPGTGRRAPGLADRPRPARPQPEVRARRHVVRAGACLALHGWCVPVPGGTRPYAPHRRCELECATALLGRKLCGTHLLAEHTCLG